MAWSKHGCYKYCCKWVKSYCESVMPFCLKKSALGDLRIHFKASTYVHWATPLRYSCFLLFFCFSHSTAQTCHHCPILFLYLVSLVSQELPRALPPSILVLNPLFHYLCTGSWSIWCNFIVGCICMGRSWSCTTTTTTTRYK